MAPDAKDGYEDDISPLTVSSSSYRNQEQKSVRKRLMTSVNLLAGSITSPHDYTSVSPAPVLSNESRARVAVAGTEGQRHVPPPGVGGGSERATTDRPSGRTDRRRRLKFGSMGSRQLMLLMLALLGLTALGGYTFSAVELRREMEEARDARRGAARIAEISSLLNSTDGRYARGLYFDLERAQNVDWRCGMCAGIDRHHLLDFDFRGYDFGSADADATRAALDEICEAKVRYCKWRFIGAAYFAFTCYTTIGYGDFAPRTDEGKVLVVLVTVFGMAVAFKLFKAVGERMFRRMHHHLPRRASLALSLLFVLYIVGGGCYFRGADLLQGGDEATYATAMYFAFVTVSTLGLGDVLPRVEDLPMISCYVYAVLGISLASAALQANAENAVLKEIGVSSAVRRFTVLAQRTKAMTRSRIDLALSVRHTPTEGSPSPASSPCRRARSVPPSGRPAYRRSLSGSTIGASAAAAAAAERRGSGSSQEDSRAAADLDDLPESATTAPSRSPTTRAARYADPPV